MPTEAKPSQEDLDLAREWIRDFAPCTTWNNGETPEYVLKSLTALLATVRAEALAAGQCCDPEAHEKIRAEGEQAGRAAERREVVAWINTRYGPWDMGNGAEAVEWMKKHLAKYIERGAHAKG